MNRRQFLTRSLGAGLGLCLPPLVRDTWARKRPQKKLLVLGVDGMDPHLTSVYLQKGLLPNLQQVIDAGSIRKLGTSLPPQSPVAWSDVIVGGSPANHGVYDFIHRDPKTLAPYLSTSRVRPASRVLHAGPYRIPLTGGGTDLLRQGKPFWDYLAERDVPTTLFKMPANFPCKSDSVDMVSGMGTPDMRGGYGNFTFYSNDPQYHHRAYSGGKNIAIEFKDNQAKTSLPGPANTFREGSPAVEIPVTIWRDATHSVARILLQDHELILKEGEWSGWLQVSFPLLGPLADAKGICKLFVKSIHPYFSLYVSPINIDPSEPALPIVSSEKYGRLLTENNGFFYTQGFPEDTKALSEGILSERQYLDLAEQIITEREKLFHFEMSRFDRLDSGMLFFYFSSIDQNSHMYWRMLDTRHPLYSPELARDYGDTMKGFYARIDSFVGRVIDRYDIHDPQFGLIIMSDHGFAPFRRQVHLNNWLYEAGYLGLNKQSQLEDNGYFTNVNWAQTAAYNLGINAIYLNVQGREPGGTVAPAQVDRLAQRLQADLLQLTDPETGEKAVSRVHRITDAERQRQPHAPDFIVGWNYGYRTSWGSILGGFDSKVFSDNQDKWSGDHCMDPNLVPALLITNRPGAVQQPHLQDVAPTVLSEFDIAPGAEMKGKPIYPQA